ncbi:hypothetical protein ACJMK2_017504 [Sinanodonta woodiana]|uniref:Uncharacterized protein n=1 Tax=Sinanodonta woodiana TaxID=1069815 RepID=A0ABD3UAJ8_SINWO
MIIHQTIPCQNQPRVILVIVGVFIKKFLQKHTSTICYFGMLCGTKGNGCLNSTVYNDCGKNLQSNISSVLNQNALTFEALSYICWSGSDTVKCFLNGLRDCPNSNLTFQSEFILQQWNVALIGQLFALGCQTPEFQVFLSNYVCLKENIESTNYNTCLSQAVAANPLGVNSLISCGLQTDGKNCITTYIGGNCNNQTALDFFLRWYFIKGNFEPNCSKDHHITINMTMYMTIHRATHVTKI